MGNRRCRDANSVSAVHRRQRLHYRRGAFSVTKDAGQLRLVDEHEAAAILGLSVKTLRRWRWAGREVPFIKLGGAVRYSLDDLNEYIDGHRCQSTSLARVAA